MKASKKKFESKAQAQFALMCAATNRAVAARASLGKPKSKSAEAVYDMAQEAYSKALAKSKKAAR